MYRVCLALLLLLSLRPAPVVASSVVGEAGRWLAVLEPAQQVVLGAEAAALREWVRQAVPDGNAPPTALPPPSSLRLARVPDVLGPLLSVPMAASPCGPQSLPYHATAPPLLA